MTVICTRCRLASTRDTKPGDVAPAGTAFEICDACLQTMNPRARPVRR